MSAHTRLTSDPGLLLALAAALIGAGLRVLALPPVVGDVDSVNFAKALHSFDPLAQAPHLPGYPPLVAAAKLWRAAGVASDVWAVALTGIVAWPAAALLLFVGARPHVGSAAALGAVLAASLAPGAVLAA